MGQFTWDDSSTASGGRRHCLCGKTKKRIAGEETQALVLSRWMRDTTDLSGKVAGIQVATYTSVSLMEVTFVLLLLHRGTQCAELRRKVVHIARQ